MERIEQLLDIGSFHIYNIMKPYKDKNIEPNVVIREFDDKLDSEELVWHRDNEDRLIEVIGETDWMFQRDNELPIKMVGKFEIPKQQWHRAIKGSGKLILKITKLK